MANREAWKSGVVSTLGRQRRVDCKVEGDRITVLWAETFYGGSLLTDYLMAASAHEDCAQMQAASLENPRQARTPAEVITNWDEFVMWPYRFC